MAHTVVLFSQPGWMFCNRTKEFLRQNNIEFTDRDITMDETAIAELEKLGVMTTPVTLVDGQMVIGYDLNRLKTMLGLWNRELSASDPMSDKKPYFALPGLKIPPRVPKPSELLFEFHRASNHKFFLCELRDHGKYGVEAQFFEGGDFLLGRRFEDVNNGERIVKARELAIAWANGERVAIETDSGALESHPYGIWQPASRHTAPPAQ